MASENPGVVAVPADHGLSVLGLLMQLAGTVFAIGVPLFVFTAGRTPHGLTETLWAFSLIGLCITRSVFLYYAGLDLLYARTAYDGSVRTPLHGIRRYIIVAIAHTLVFALMLALKFDVPLLTVLGISLGLLLWPGILAATIESRIFAPYRTEIPVSEDKGFEGVSIVMTVLGMCGALGMLAILFAMFGAGARALQQGRIVMVMLAVVMLCSRSIMHARAGLAGLRETSLDRSVELAGQYSTFGVITAFCTGGALLLAVMTSSPDVAGVITVVSVCGLLLSWPMLVRRFFSDRHFVDLMSDARSVSHHRAPDAGLTGLGWLLLAHAAFAATCTIPQLIGARGLPTGFDTIYELFGGAASRSPWLTFPLLALQTWAGFQLICMGRHHRILASAFAVIAIGLTIYAAWPALVNMRAAGSLVKPGLLIGLAPLAMALVLPAATLALVNRATTPRASARYRAGMAAT